MRNTLPQLELLHQPKALPIPLATFLIINIASHAITPDVHTVLFPLSSLPPFTLTPLVNRQYQITLSSLSSLQLVYVVHLANDAKWGRKE